MPTRWDAEQGRAVHIPASTSSTVNKLPYGATDDTPAGRMGIDPRDPWYDEINNNRGGGGTLGRKRPGLPKSVRDAQRKMEARADTRYGRISSDDGMRSAKIYDVPLELKGDRPDAYNWMGAGHPPAGSVDHARRQEMAAFELIQNTYGSLENALNEAEQRGSSGIIASEFIKDWQLAAIRARQQREGAATRTDADRARRRHQNRGYGGGRMRDEWNDPGYVVPGDGSSE